MEGCFAFVLKFLREVSITRGGVIRYSTVFLQVYMSFFSDRAGKAVTYFSEQASNCKFAIVLSLLSISYSNGYSIVIFFIK